MTQTPATAATYVRALFEYTLQGVTFAETDVAFPDADAARRYVLRTARSHGLRMRKIGIGSWDLLDIEGNRVGGAVLESAPYSDATDTYVLLRDATGALVVGARWIVSDHPDADHVAVESGAASASWLDALTEEYARVQRDAATDHAARLSWTAPYLVTHAQAARYPGAWQRWSATRADIAAALRSARSAVGELGVTAGTVAVHTHTCQRCADWALLRVWSDAATGRDDFAAWDIAALRGAAARLLDTDGAARCIVCGGPYGQRRPSATDLDTTYAIASAALGAAPDEIIAAATRLLTGGGLRMPEISDAERTRRYREAVVMWLDAARLWRFGVEMGARRDDITRDAEINRATRLYGRTAGRLIRDGYRYGMQHLPAGTSAVSVMRRRERADVLRELARRGTLPGAAMLLHITDSRYRPVTFLGYSADEPGYAWCLTKTGVEQFAVGRLESDPVRAAERDAATRDDAARRTALADDATLYWIVFGYGRDAAGGATLTEHGRYQRHHDAITRRAELEIDGAAPVTYFLLPVYVRDEALAYDRPILTGDPVTAAHVAYCDAHGHYRHRDLTGTVHPRCVRCGYELAEDSPESWDTAIMLGPETAETAENSTVSETGTAADLTEHDARIAVVAAIEASGTDVARAEEFDVQGIVAEIRDRTGGYDTEALDHDVFWQIVERHALDTETGETGTGETGTAAETGTGETSTTETSETSETAEHYEYFVVRDAIAPGDDRTAAAAHVLIHRTDWWDAALVALRSHMLNEARWLNEGALSLPVRHSARAAAVGRALDIEHAAMIVSTWTKDFLGEEIHIDAAGVRWQIRRVPLTAADAATLPGPADDPWNIVVPVDQRCPACGSATSDAPCSGHDAATDPRGYARLRAHHAGNHFACEPAACAQWLDFCVRISVAGLSETDSAVYYAVDAYLQAQVSHQLVDPDRGGVLLTLGERGYTADDVHPLYRMEIASEFMRIAAAHPLAWRMYVQRHGGEQWGADYYHTRQRARGAGFHTGTPARPVWRELAEYWARIAADAGRAAVLTPLPSGKLAPRDADMSAYRL